MNESHLKLAASVFPRLEARRYRTSRKYRDEINAIVTTLGVGGFVVFDGDVNDVRHATKALGEIAEGRLIFSADCEDGVTMRFPGGTEFPSMMALGVVNDPASTYSVARSIAREMRAIGLIWNFAPVADVNSNPDNPIINVRSFGSDPVRVADQVLAYVRGMQDGGVIASVKHFPGHGDTAADSHVEVPVVTRDRKSLDAVELMPFREAIRNGVMSVMVSHLAVPALDPAGTPASLSRPIVQDLLRDELGYDGLVVTDALDMHAISRQHTSEEAAMRAYSAGCDVLCIPESPACAVKGLMKLAEAGRVGKRRINRTHERIKSARGWARAFSDVSPTIASAVKGHNVVALDAARRSIMTLGRVRKLHSPVLVLLLHDAHAGSKPADWLTLFTSWHSGRIDYHFVGPELESPRKSGLLSAIDRAGSVVMPIFVRPRGFAGTVGLSKGQNEIALRALKKRCVVLTFGNPYVLPESDPNVRINCYSASSATLAASIEAVARAVM